MATIDNKNHASRVYGRSKRAASGTQVVKIQRSNISRVITFDNEQQQAFIRLLPVQSDDTIYEFHFPYSPVNITYDGLSNEIAEIDRPGATAIIAYKKHQLMKVSFDFVLAVPFDGVTTSIDSDITLLRKIAEHTSRPVQVFNLDKMFERTANRRYQPANTRHRSYVTKFRIADLSVSSAKRNASGGITQADCKITLIEDVNPKIDTALIPKFVPPPAIPKKPTTPTKTTATELPLSSKQTDAAAGGRPPWAAKPGGSIPAKYR
jgi:hypothetical protein